MTCVTTLLIKTCTRTHVALPKWASHIILLNKFIPMNDNVFSTRGAFPLVSSDHDHRFLKPLIGWETSVGTHFVLHVVVKNKKPSQVNTNEKVTWKWLMKSYTFLQRIMFDGHTDFAKREPKLIISTKNTVTILVHFTSFQKVMWISLDHIH